MRIDYYVAALCYVYLWRSTSSAQFAHSVRAKYVLIVLLRKQILEAVSGVHCSLIKQFRLMSSSFTFS